MISDDKQIHGKHDKNPQYMSKSLNHRQEGKAFEVKLYNKIV